MSSDLHHHVAALSPSSVSVVLARVLRDAWAHQGMPVDVFHRCSEVSAYELNLPALRLGIRRHERLRGLIAQLGAPAGDRSPIDSHQLRYYWPHQAALWFNQPDAARAIQDWVRFRALIGSIDVVSLQNDADRLVLTYRPEDKSESALFSVLANFALLREMLQAHQDAAGPRGLQLRAELAGGGLSRARLAWQHQLRMSVRSGCEVEAHRLIISGPALRAALIPHDPWAAERSRRRLQADVSSLSWRAVTDNLVSRVEVVLCSFWDAAYARVPEVRSDHDIDLAVEDWDVLALQRAVAQALGYSRWTLRRHLEAAGLPFADLVERLRVQRLDVLLPRTDISLQEVAWRIGFRSISAFSRYHRRRYGQAPSVRRRSMVAGAA